MKYKNISGADEKILHITIPTKGINLNSSQSFKNDFLGLCENISHKNGKLVTRNGFNTDIEKILKVPDFDGYFNIDYKLTQTVFYKNKIPFQLAFADIEYDFSNRFYNMFLIGEDGNYKNAGYIHFGRVDDNTFYIPENINFYTGNPQNGGGIFALVMLKNLYNESEKEAVIFEINENLDGWNRVTDYYIPTVYINGRGNRYEFAKQSGQVFQNAPKTLENLNIISGEFYAYYTSDGHSSSFRLPFSNIADSSVICRIYTSLTEYTEWCVHDGEITDTKDFFGSQVTINVDRQKGTVFFTVDKGDFSIPLMSVYNENNIRILAKTYTDADILMVATARCNAVRGNEIYFAGCSDKNRVYYTSYDKPLYFPQITDNFIGSADSEVIALCANKDSLYIFKDTGIYKAEIKGKNSLNTTALLADNGTVFYGVEAFNIKTVLENYGVIYKATLGTLNGRCIWFDGENIYLLSASGNEILNISKEISTLFKNFTKEEKEKAVAICSGNNYILSLGGKMIIIEFENNDICRCIWSLPDGLNVIGAFKIKKDMFLCKSDDICYICKQEGNCDTVITHGNGVLKTETSSIKSMICFAGINFGNFAKRRKFKKIHLDFDAENDVTMSIKTAHNISSYTLTQNNILNKTEFTRIFTDFYCDGIIDLSFKSDGGITLGDFDIYYTEV